MAFFAAHDERLQPELPFDRHEAVAHLSAADPHLAALIERVGAYDLTLHPIHNTFAAVARVIVYQQLSGRAAGTIFGRVAALFGGEDSMSARALEDLSDEQLRAAGLSRGKLAALRDLARFARDGNLPVAKDLRQMEFDELHDILTNVRGVGPWSVEMIAMFWLGHPDILPTTDLGIRKGYQLLRALPDLPSPSDLVIGSEPWRPYRSVAAWYLWRAVDTATV